MRSRAPRDCVFDSPLGSPVKWVPKPYMRKAVKHLLANPAAGLLLDPGLCKTSITLQAFKTLQRAGVVDRMLVLAPLQVCHNVWPAEAWKWDGFRDLKVVVLHGPKKDQALRSNADVFVINYEGLPWLVKQTWEWPEMLVCDESTKLKNTRTQRFKLLKARFENFDRRYILTGTPVPNGLIDLFGQLFVLDLGERLGAYISHYRSRYFMQSGYGGFDWRPLPDAEDRIYKQIGDVCLRMGAEDYLELPELTKTTVPFSLSPKARSQYDRLAKEFFLALDAGDVDAINAGVLSGKLRQVINGAVYNDIGGVSHVHDDKLTVLADLVEQIGQPTIIAYEFRHDLARLLDLYPMAGVLGGGISKKKAIHTIEEWSAGDLQVLLCHPAAAAYGLNLQDGGHHMVWFGLTWNLEYYAQLIARLWRQGQAQRVFVYHIIAQNTLDEVVWKVLQQKAQTQKSLLAQLKRWRKRK